MIDIPLVGRSEVKRKNPFNSTDGDYQDSHPSPKRLPKRDTDGSLVPFPIGQLDFNLTPTQFTRHDQESPWIQPTSRRDDSLHSAYLARMEPSNSVAASGNHSFAAFCTD